MNKKIIIGLSGGVDSAVSAYLLKKSGYDVEAVFMNNWDTIINGEDNYDKNQGCTNNQDLEDAIAVANHLNIKLHIANFIEKYWNEVFLIFLEKYKNGITPNPDVLCNKFIKFEAFRNYVFDNFTTDYFALGHYALKRENSDNTFDLLMSKDEKKDQTYFLCDLNQIQLSKVVFPIGDYLKSDVRKIAKSAKLPNWDKKDSTGICFIGKRNFGNFLSNYIPNKKGDIVDIKTNKVIGTHNSVMYYTIGQRKKIGLSGMDKKYYICKKDIANNILYVANDDNLEEINNFNAIDIKNFNWINKIVSPSNIKIRYRHCGELFNAKIVGKINVTIEFEKHQKFIALGQYAVIYLNNTCLGGGEITKIYQK